VTDFVVTYQAYISGTYEIYAQRYNSSGLAQGTEFRVNDFTTGGQRNSSVAMDSLGNFTVTWESYAQDGANYGIYAQRYNAAGVAQGVQFLVNTTTSGKQSDPSIAMDRDGDFVVTWDGYAYTGDDDGIYAQRYNAAGVAQGSEFRVNTYTTYDQRYSSVAMDSDGDFVVVWESYGQDGSNRGIYGQRYNASGVAQGSEFQVNTYTTSSQVNTSVAMDRDGDFVVTWRSTGQDTYTSNNQNNSAVAMDADGDFVVTWQSYGQDGSGSGVYAQRYTGGFTTSTQAAQALSAFVLYPNPAKDQVSFNLEGEVSVKIMDLSGQVVREASAENQGFNIAGLKAGVYMVELTKNGENVVKKLVVE
jgi:Secretion system C-terminal sorting domain